MATGKPVGTMFVELSLDATKYTKSQRDILAGAEKNSEGWKLPIPAMMLLGKTWIFVL